MNTDALGPTIEMVGSSPVFAADARRVADVAATEEIEVSVYLKPRSMPDLSKDGRSLAERRAALRAIRTEEHHADIRLLREFAVAHHLTVGAVEPARRLVKLAGTAASMQAAFAVELGIHDQDGERFRSYAGPIRLPARVEAVVQAILGLDTRSVTKPQFIRGNLVTAHLPNEFGTLYGFPTAGTGSGQCIGIIEFCSPNRPDAGYLQSDIVAAFNAMNLPIPVVTAVLIPQGTSGGTNNHGFSFTMTVSAAGPGAPIPGGGNLIRLTVNDTTQARFNDEVLVENVTAEANGARTIRVIDRTHIDLLATSFHTAYAGSGGTVYDPTNADSEVALDIQVAGGVAPGALQAVYFALNNDQGWVDAISQAAADQINNPGVISISWGGREENWNVMARLAVDGAFADAALTGVLVFAASGDHLSTEGDTNGQVHVLFPASSPFAIGCGGTRIDTTGSEITNEVVWNDGVEGTGGGISRLYQIPPFQSGANLPVNVSTQLNGRGVPDVAGNASGASGYTIYNSPFGPNAVGGTSAVAPLWAGLTVLLNEGLGTPIASFLANLYQNTSVFRVITNGDNFPTNTQLGYRAGPGWSGCTGLGVPKGYALFSQLVGIRPFGTVATFGVLPGVNGVLVLFRDLNGHIVHLLNWWSSNSTAPGAWQRVDLNSVQPTPTLTQGAPCAAFIPSANQLQMHVVYRDINNHISDIWGTVPTPGTWQDLNTVVPGARSATSDPLVVLSGSQMHVLYRDTQNHISDLEYDGPSQQWTYTDLTSLLMPAQGAPSGAIFNNELNVCWRDRNNHISIIIKAGSTFVSDLNALTNAPDARSDPYVFLLSSPQQMHVLYRDTNNHISDFCVPTDGGLLTCTDLNLAAVPPPTAAALGKPCGAEFLGGLYVVYRNADNHISCIFGTAPGFPTSGLCQDLNAMSGAPAAKGDPFCYAVPGIPILAVTYVDINDHVAFLYGVKTWIPSNLQWRYLDLTQAAQAV